MYESPERLCISFAGRARRPQPFDLRDGDCVVFPGDTLMEREKDYGSIELTMTLRFPERNVTFRNLGWSADTVGISRVSFDQAKAQPVAVRAALRAKENDFA